MSIPTTMVKTIRYDESMEEFIVTLHIPHKMRGTYTYGDGEWETDAVCVWIDNSRYEFGLYHTQYLDYKDSLQATAPIFYFDNEKEALQLAEKYGLMVEYGHNHNHFKSDE